MTNKISVSLTKEEWKLLLIEIEAGIECRDEQGDFIISDLLNNIKYEISKSI